METLIAIDLTVIAICFIATTIATVVLAVVGYRILRKLEESVDIVNTQLKPAVLELKGAIVSVTEIIQSVVAPLSFIRNFKKKGS